MGETVDFRTKEQKRAEFKDRVARGLYGVWSKVERHRDDVVVLAPVIVPGLIFITKMVLKKHNLKKAEELKELYCYDNKLGHYWKLKRALSNKEWLEIDRRKRMGERLADILSDMRVLK